VAADLTHQPSREERAIGLLEEWLADESGYDERIWPELSRLLDDDRLSDREFFHG
jgi:hypothetical protein